MLWTVDQFHYLGDLGMFEGRRAMLLEGVIVEEGPMNPPHRIALELTADAIRLAFGTGWRFCVQRRSYSAGHRVARRQTILFTNVGWNTICEMRLVNLTDV